MNKVVRSSKLFDGFGDAEFKRVLALFEHRSYEPLSTIFLEYMPGNTLLVLEKGLVKITKIRDEFEMDQGEDVVGEAQASRNSMERTLVHIKPGEFFGEMSFIDGKNRSASAFAIEKSEILALDRKVFETLSRDDTMLAFKLAMNMARIMSGRLRQTDQLVVGLTDMLFKFSS
ncbi:MAG: cyclic nucleotide-binding domain-containing protein [Myxococcota bacterium]|jgi:CRP-like cAMP-binding protein